MGLIEQDEQGNLFEDGQPVSSPQRAAQILQHLGTRGTPPADEAALDTSPVSRGFSAMGQTFSEGANRLTDASRNWGSRLLGLFQMAQAPGEGLATAGGTAVENSLAGTFLGRDIPGTGIAPSDVAAGLTYGTLAALRPAGGLGSLLGAAWRSLPLSRLAARAALANFSTGSAADAFKVVEGAAAPVVGKETVAAMGALGQNPNLGNAVLQTLRESPYLKGLLNPNIGTLTKYNLSSLSYKDADMIQKGLRQAALSADNPSVTQELWKLRDGLIADLEKANPGYADALSQVHREQSISRLQELIQKQADPAGAFAALRAKGQVIGDNGEIIKEGRDLSMKAFSTQELNQIQSILDRLPQSVGFRRFIETRMMGTLDLTQA